MRNVLEQYREQFLLASNAAMCFALAGHAAGLVSGLFVLFGVLDVVYVVVSFLPDED